GTSFSPVSIATGQPTPPYVWSIASTGGSKFVLALEAVPGTLGQIWISADNGASWTQGSNVTSPLGVARMTVASAPSAPNIVYALASTSSGNLADIYRSTTGGAFWRSLRATSSRTVYTNPNPTATRPTQLFNTQGWYDQMLLVNPANPNEAFYGGALHTAKVVVGSMGAADRWTMISEWLGRYNLPYVHADAHAAAYDAAGRLYFGTDGGVFMSPDNGVNFTDRLNIGIVTHLIYNLGSSTAAGSLVVGGFQDNGTRTRSGATSTFNQTIGGDGFGCDVHKTDGSLVLGSLYNARIQKSTNGGVNFSPACSGIAECGTSSAPFYTKVVPWTGSATGDVVFTHSNTRMYKSANYADSWTGLTPVPTGTIRNINVAHSNPDVLGIVASGGAAYVSNNGGTSWTPVATLPNNGLSLSYIWFDRADPNIVYVSSVAPNASATHLWKSLNFGQSWTAIDGGGFPTGVPVDVIKTDPLAPATLYAGTHLGVYRSDDAGANWVRYGSGLPLVEVTDVYISADASLVRASTFGRGFWELVP
ncbi:MAG TPA: hypothetical protein VFO85_17730, partial [Vicinamibacteria bacterium]|nr:hypothetical protein [Vicinamibacteria bacterium]